MYLYKSGGAFQPGLCLQCPITFAILVYKALIDNDFCGSGKKGSRAITLAALCYANLVSACHVFHYSLHVQLD